VRRGERRGERREMRDEREEVRRGDEKMCKNETMKVR
jgi:hypothetical protein